MHYDGVGLVEAGSLCLIPAIFSCPSPCAVSHAISILHNNNTYRRAPPILKGSRVRGAEVEHGCSHSQERIFFPPARQIFPEKSFHDIGVIPTAA